MALFTDGLISTIEELLGYESAILDVARTEGIDLTTKLSLAEQELAVNLQAFLARQDQDWDLDQIVVTEPLHKWHTFQTLSITYRDAYNREVNDRYEGKWRQYSALATWATNALYDAGVGMVNEPVARAECPAVSTIAGTGGAATYYVAVTWMGENGAEGTPSDLVALTVSNGSAITVQPVNRPDNAYGWNVYAGYAGSALSLQNDLPLLPGQKWTEPSGGLRNGRRPGAGQKPDAYVRQSIRQILYRG